MPFYSSQDIETIDKEIDSRNAFLHVRDETTRQLLKARAAQCKRIVTLDSFRADTIFLETCYNPLSKLFSPRERSLQEVCKFSFQHAPELFRVRYVDLWLQTMRNYVRLSNLRSAKPRKDRGQDMKEPLPKSDAQFMELAFYASSRGFETDEIAMQLAKGTGKICQDPTCADPPEFSSDRDSLPVQFRCNRSSDSMFETDRRYLSLKNVYQVSTGPRKKSPASFAVLKDIICCFFGEIAPTELLTNGDGPSFEADLPTEMTVLTSPDNIVRPPPSSCEGSTHPPSALSATRPRPAGHRDGDEMDIVHDVPEKREQSVSEREGHSQQSDGQLRRQDDPGEEEGIGRTEHHELHGLRAQQSDQPTPRSLNEVIPLDDFSADKVSLRPPAESEQSEIEPGEDSQPLREQTLQNGATGENDSAVTNPGESENPAHKKRLTGRQVQDEAMQRRNKENRLRHQIAQKFTGQRGPVEAAGPNSRPRVGGESQTQAHLHDAKRHNETHEFDEDVETFSQQMQQAEDQMLGAAEAVEEVYEENTEDTETSPQQETAGVSERHIPMELRDQTKRITPFPGGGVGMDFNVPTDGPPLSGLPKPVGVDEAGRSEAREDPSERPKRKAIRNADELLGYRDDDSAQDGRINPTDADKQNAHIVDPRPSLLADRRITPFPGPLDNLERLQHSTAGSKSREERAQCDANDASHPVPKGDDQLGPGIRAPYAEMPKRRKRSGEVEGRIPA